MAPCGPYVQVRAAPSRRSRADRDRRRRRLRLSGRVQTPVEGVEDDVTDDLAERQPRWTPDAGLASEGSDSYPVAGGGVDGRAASCSVVAGARALAKEATRSRCAPDSMSIC